MAEIREITQWRCERCGTIYVEKTTAERCFKSHKKPMHGKDAIATKWVSMFADKDTVNDPNYPTTVEVTFEDGAVGIYAGGVTSK